MRAIRAIGLLKSAAPGLTEKDWQPVPGVNSPEQFSWVSRNKMDIPAVAVGGLAAGHGLYSGYRKARKAGRGVAMSALAGLGRGAVQGVAGFGGTQAARRGIGRVVTNLVSPFGYDDPLASMKLMRGMPVGKQVAMASKSIWNDVPLETLLGKNTSYHKEPGQLDARLGLWDAFWGRSTRRAGDMYYQDPADPQRLRVNLNSSNPSAKRMADLLEEHARSIPSGESNTVWDAVMGNVRVHNRGDTLAVDDWWDVSNRPTGVEAGPLSANAALRALATLIGRPKMISARLPANGMRKQNALEKIAEDALQDVRVPSLSRKIYDKLP